MNSLSRRPSHWADINEATFVTGIRFLFWIGKNLGRWPFRLVLYPVLVWYIATRPVARHASYEYLCKIFAMCRDPSYKPCLKRIFSHFAAFGESILDKLLIWSGNFPLETVIFHGNEPLNNHIHKRQGCLLICSHLGNLELCKALSGKKPGLKATMLVHTRHAEVFNRLLKQFSPESQFNLMQVADMSPATILVLSEKIREGEFIIIAGDRIPVSGRSRTVTVPFMGCPAPFPIGPYVLGSLLQCPVYLMFTIRTPNANEIFFEPFRESIRFSRKERDATLQKLAADYADRLQHYCLKAPLQWFNFYPFWETHLNRK